jgi:hypothetical protein
MLVFDPNYSLYIQSSHKVIKEILVHIDLIHKHKHVE